VSGRARHPRHAHAVNPLIPDGAVVQEVYLETKIMLTPEGKAPGAAGLPAGTRAGSDGLQADLESFRDIWPGGYHEGFPLDPVGESSYGPFGYMSVLYVVYLTCIRPYVNQDTVALEIGPGRGAWTRAMLKAREIWCLDVRSDQENGFSEYLGHPKNVRYVQVSDFSCSDLPENHFDYAFSFGCFCHIPFSGVRAYMQNLFPKLKPNARGFIMVADYEKYRKAVANIERLDVVGREFRRRLASRAWIRPLVPLLGRRRPFRADHVQDDDVPRPGRWYDAGVDQTCRMLRECGYTVVCPDLEVTVRDPVIEFTK
jgi:phospholipid N-methyltransferase